MDARMSAQEANLFQSFLHNAEQYLEFGSGGSTYQAAKVVKSRVVSLDSSVDWLGRVSQACTGEECKVKPTLVHIDIGATGDWGRPTDPLTRDRWPSYYESIWDHKEGSDADLYLIDGRFRVACFAKVLLNCLPHSFIMFHDFASRRQYHVVRKVAREVASAEDLSVFAPILGQKREEIREILAQHRFNPD